MPNHIQKGRGCFALDLDRLHSPSAGYPGMLADEIVRERVSPALKKLKGLGGFHGSVATASSLLPSCQHAHNIVHVILITLFLFRSPFPSALLTVVPV